MRRNQPSSFIDAGNPTEEAMFGDNRNMSHYEMPNLAACLYEYTNKEQDTILRCFRNSNFDSIRDLPTSLGPQSVIEQLKEKITKNISKNEHEPERDHRGKIVKLAGGGLFHEFEWMPDSFFNFLNSQRQDKHESDDIINKLHDKPFISTHDPITSKYENPFNAGKKETVFPLFREVEDPYEASKDDMNQEKWHKKANILRGEFKPATSEKSLTQINRGQLPDIVIFLKEIIRIDWAEINFIIGTNPEEYIEIKFEKSPDGELGLKSYMNNLIHNHETISHFHLKKVMSFWGHTDDKYIYFMLMPPWVKAPVAAAYTSLITKDQSTLKTESDESASREGGKSKKKTAPKLYSAEIDI